MQAVLELAAQARAAREGNQVTAYRELVAAVATETFDGAPEDVLSICEAADKSLDNLERDSANVAKRAKLTAEIAAGEKAHAQLKITGAELNASEQKRSAELERHRQACEKLHQEMSRLRAVMQRAAVATREWKDTPNPLEN